MVTARRAAARLVHSDAQTAGPAERHGLDEGRQALLQRRADEGQERDEDEQEDGRRRRGSQAARARSARRSSVTEDGAIALHELLL